MNSTSGRGLRLETFRSSPPVIGPSRAPEVRGCPKPGNLGLARRTAQAGERLGGWALRVGIAACLTAALEPAWGAAAEPELTVPPHKLTVGVGGTARFEAVVTGSEPITCLWFHDGVEVSRTEGDATLTLSNVQEPDRGEYRLEAWNAAGSVASTAVVLTVMPRRGTEVFDPVVNHGAGQMPGLKHNFGMHSNHLVPVFAKGQGAEWLTQFATGRDPVRGPYLENVDLNRALRSALTNGTRNIILMISDGAGFSTYEAASYYQHGELGCQVYDRWPVQLACATSPLTSLSSPSSNSAPASTRGWYDQTIWESFYKGTSNWTDSSAAGTALSCGVKTYNFAVGWSDDNRPLPNISECAKQAFGKRVGVITTVPISHPTPAAFSAHNPSRMAFAAIAAEQLTSPIVDVLMGAGHPNFDEDHQVTEAADYSYVGGPALWAALLDGTLGWNLIQTRAEFEALADGTLLPSGRLCGVAQVRTTFQQARGSSGGEYPGGDAAHQPAYVVPFNTGVPDLPILARGALRALAHENDAGFFLMIEGGAVDLANHGAQQGRMIEEQVDFNRAVAAVESWVLANGGWAENLVVVTADHETGLIFGPTAGGVPVQPASALIPSGIASLATAGHTLELAWNGVSWATGYRVDVTYPDQTTRSFAATGTRFSLTSTSVGTYAWTVTPTNDFGSGPMSAPGSTTVLVHGLVGVGRVPADAFDARGAGLDTLGGFGSGICFDVASWRRTVLADGRETYSGTLYAAPDRGYGGGTQHSPARIQTFDLAITPDFGTEPAGQTQVALHNTATRLLTSDGVPLTGHDPDDTAAQEHPQSLPDSAGQVHRSLDAEGLVLLPDGGFCIGDEYGTCISKFSAAGHLEYTMWPPAALVPRRGDYPGVNWFTGGAAPDSGRLPNRGFGGLSLTPDGTRLAAILESPTAQDGGADDLSRQTRVLLFDLEPDSPTFGQAVEEYVYTLTVNGNAATSLHTTADEILALNATEFLILEQDAWGLGAGPTAPGYKRVVLASSAGATNLIDTGFDLERGAPGATVFGRSSFPTKVAPLRRTDLIDLLDPAQLARFGLNSGTNQDAQSLAASWESLAPIPLNDPDATNEFLLLTLNDNGFNAPVVYQNGVPVGTSETPVDTMALAYRVRLPTYGAPRPANQSPQVVITTPASAFLSTTGALSLGAAAYDQDGRVTRVDFYESGRWLGAATSFPFQIVLADWPPGTYDFSAIAADNRGQTSTPTHRHAEVRFPDLPLVLRIACGTDPQTGLMSVTATFETLVGKHYQLWSAPEVGGPWQNLTRQPIVGTGLTARVTDSPAHVQQTFYRAVALD